MTTTEIFPELLEYRVSRREEAEIEPSGSYLGDIYIFVLIMSRLLTRWTEYVMTSYQGLESESMFMV